MTLKSPLMRHSLADADAARFAGVRAGAAALVSPVCYGFAERMRNIEPRDSTDQPSSIRGKRRPSLPGGPVIVRPGTDELLDSVATDLFLHANACAREFGDFHLALSVWPEAEPLFLRLLYDPRYRDLPWRRTHLWIVEENGTDNTDRFAILRDSIVAQSDIPAEQVHRPAPGIEYETVLKEHLGWREKGQDRLDYALLPLLAGGFSHGSPAVGPGAPLVESAGSQVRMSRRLLEATRFIAVVALGEHMDAAIRAVNSPARDPSRLFAGDLSPIGGELRWYVEEGVCEDSPALPPIPLE